MDGRLDVMGLIRFRYDKSRMGSTVAMLRSAGAKSLSPGPITSVR